MRMTNDNDKWEWEMRMTNENDKWEWQMRMTNENENKVMNLQKNIFLISCQINI